MNATGLPFDVAKMVVQAEQAGHRRRLALRLRRTGMTLAAIGGALGGISRQRVEQLIKLAEKEERGEPW